jgi:hypothetical protein
MLRRDFIKAGSIFIGGMVLLREIPLADSDIQRGHPSSNRPPHIWHHGQRRCGCATPPEKQALMEWGLYGTLPD